MQIQTTTTFVRSKLRLLALIAVSGISSVGYTSFACAAEPTYFPGIDTTQWQRPAPLIRPEYARPVSNTKIDGRYEGELFLASLPAEQRKTLLRDGSVLYGEDDKPASKSKDGGIKGFIKAVAIFNQPKQDTLALMTQPQKLVLFLDSLDKAQTVSRNDVGEITQFSVDFLWWEIDFWIQHWFYPELSRYDWYLDTKNFDNEIDGNKGFWQLYALDENRTVGEYGVYVDTGIPIPRRMFERIQRREIPKALDDFRKFIDSNGTYRKD